MLRILISLLLALFVAAPMAWAYTGTINTWQICGGLDVSGVVSTSKAAYLCFPFNDDLDSATSQQFEVTGGGGALVCLESDTTADATGGVGSATADIHRCTPGEDASDLNVCASILNTPLTGLQGKAGTQVRCVSVPKGSYHAVLVEAASGEVAVLSITRE